MGSQELIDSLRRAGEEGIRHLQQDAERDAEFMRSSLAGKTGELRKRFADEVAAFARDETRRVLAEEGGRARSIRLESEKALSDRLLSVALASLARLRHDRYPEIFEKMARELPPLPWKIVRVNPVDKELANRHFPDAEIMLVETISGGMDAETADRAINVVNTFEKRIERAWAELLPLLINDVYQEASDGASQNSR